MKNPATTSRREDFNVCTQSLKDLLDVGQRALAELRDGRIVELEWFDAEGPEYEHFCFRKNGAYLIWENSGHSITSRDFDIVGTFE